LGTGLARILSIGFRLGILSISLGSILVRVLLIDEDYNLDTLSNNYVIGLAVRVFRTLLPLDSKESNLGRRFLFIVSLILRIETACLTCAYLIPFVINSSRHIL